MNDINIGRPGLLYNLEISDCNLDNLSNYLFLNDSIINLLASELTASTYLNVEFPATNASIDERFKIKPGGEA